MDHKTIQKAKALFLAFAFFLFFGASTAFLPALPADTDLLLPEGQKLIALTFDDGPKRSTTLPLLDGLAERGVPATFFLIGEQIPANEDILRRMEAEGHQVGIHSYSHAKLTALNDADFDAEVARTHTVLENTLGHGGFLLRPPYGMTDAGVLSRADAPIILWSIDPEDWSDENSDRQVAVILDQVRDGSVILLHDIYPTSVDTALRVVDALLGQGYYFVTMEQLFAARGIRLEAGEIYRNAY